MKSRKIILVSIAAIFLLASSAFVAVASPKPYYVPPELSVNPYGQTVIGSPWRAAWDLYISGGQGTYCIRVSWGDAFPPYESCGYSPGVHYQFTHDFNKPGTTNGTKYQTWRASGVGGPVYDYTYVVRQ